MATLVLSPKPEEKKADEDSYNSIRVTDFPAELQEIISEIVPSTDPLDSPTFNPTEYINQNFPTEQSLADLDSAITRLKVKVSRTDEEILKSVREQVSAGSKGKRDLEEAKRAIGELFSKINEIKTKAEESEKMVTEICRDIKSLDYAKRNLTTTITTLKKLHMLITAVDQLKIMSSKRQYQEAGQLLEAVNQLAAHFESYKKIRKVGELITEVQDIRNGLKTQVTREFRSYLDTPANVPQTLLIDACIVIDALGKDEKKEFMSWFVGRQLEEYNRFFREGEESAQLQHTDRRFSWLKRCLRTFDEQFEKIFPAKWKMAELLCEEFCFTTRQQLGEILETTRRALDVEILVGVLKKTISFEKELAERFGPLVIEDTEEDKNVKEPQTEELTQEEIMNPNSAAAARARFQRRFQQQKAEQAKKNTAGKTREIQKFKGMISSVFDGYMELYTIKEDQNIKAYMDKLISEETWSVDDDERNKVLGSSTDLIYYFKNSMKLCSSLSKNQAFYDLYLIFKKHLTNYANILASKVPNPDARITEKEEKMLCLIVNTAEYCAQTTQGMTEAIKHSINVSFQDKVDLKDQQAEFEGVIAKATKGLVHGLENKMEPALQQMVRMPWSSWEAVDDQSEYVNQISTYISQSVPVFQDWLSNPSHFRFFCDSFCASFIPLLIQQIYKCKKISIAGAQQLILDFTAIKALLIELPNMGKAQPNPVPGRYTRHIQKELGKAELILKVILTPVSSLVDTYKALIVDGSESDFQKLLDLKGIPRSEAKALVDQYIQTTEHKEPSPASPSPAAMNVGGKTFTRMFTGGMTDFFTKGGEATKRILKVPTADNNG